MRCAVGLGQVVSLVVRTGYGDFTIVPKAKWLCWDQSRRDLVIGTRTGTAPLGDLPAKVITIHTRFHTEHPTSARHVEVPSSAGAHPIGLLAALTYKVPSDIRSPQKNPYKWVHWFGDHGERGHGEADDTPEYPAQLMPLLMQRGPHWFIKRRRGNKYFVTDWLYW